MLNAIRRIPVADRIAGFAVFLLALVAAGALLELWRADVRVPFQYSSDGLVIQTCLKGMQENGWHLHNPRLGVPDELDLNDYPMPDHLHFLILKLMLMCGAGPALAFNSYYVLTFPLAALAAWIVFRRFGMNTIPAIAGSLLFAFLPYHFHRGQIHLYLSAYYLVPFMTMVILWVWQGRGPFLCDEDGALRVQWRSGCAAATLAIALLVSSAGIYYAFFGCCLTLVAGFVAVTGRRLVSIGNALLIVLVIGIGVGANLSPSLWYWHEHGANPQAVKRSPREAEELGLKVTQMLLPVTDHRWPFLANIKRHYNEETLFVNENDSCTLGVVGSLGFLGLLCWLALRMRYPRDASLADGLAVLCLAGVALGTVGGLGGLFSFAVSPSIRAMDRAIVYIAFVSLFAAVVALDRLCSIVGPARRRVCYAAISLVTVLALLDQTPANVVPDYKGTKERYEHDKDFFAQVEASLPAHSMIFQMPWCPFPEIGQVQQMGDYEHIRGYLHSRTLRWSYGVMNGREGEFIRDCAASPSLEILMQKLWRGGFRGVYVDRRGYADRGERLERELTRIFQTTPIVSRDGTMFVVPMQNQSAAIEDFAARP